MLYQLVFAPSIVNKLQGKMPPVTVSEVEEAFFQWGGYWVLDNREDHRTIPPTYWFLSETFDGRLLKIVIKPVPNTDYAYVRTAYDAYEEEIKIYEQKKTNYKNSVR